MKQGIFPPHDKQDKVYQKIPPDTEAGVTFFVDGELLIELTDLNWEQLVERSERPVLVMFYSLTCPHCRTMEPSFRQYAREYEGIVSFARLDITTAQWTAERYGVRSTPTFKMFCTGKPFLELVGTVYPALLKRMVDEGLASGNDCVAKSTPINYDITGYG
ncbi:MAG: thioredoxin family protein [Methanoregulaceae archaeon]|nr:thioredoxin family protein [Methanoregulaceae archaeon]